MDDLLPIGTRVRCKITKLGIGVVSGHILVDGPYRVRFDSETYDAKDPTDAHHRARQELAVLRNQEPKTCEKVGCSNRHYRSGGYCSRSHETDARDDELNARFSVSVK